MDSDRSTLVAEAECHGLNVSNLAGCEQAAIVLLLLGSEMTQAHPDHLTASSVILNVKPKPPAQGVVGSRENFHFENPSGLRYSSPSGTDPGRCMVCEDPSSIGLPPTSCVFVFSSFTKSSSYSLTILY